MALLGYAFYALVPVGYDFYHWYGRTPLQWLAGETRLYDAASRGYYLAPWATWLLLPFAALGFRGGMAALSLLTIALVAAVSVWYTARWCGARAGAPLRAALAVLCPYTLTALFAGTIDAWSMAGVFLGFVAAQRRQPWLLGAAVSLALVRPQNAVLTLPLLLVGVRHWSPGELARAAAVPSAAVLASLAVFGIDWPLRWVANVRAAPPIPYLVTSTYAATGLAGLPLPLVVAGTGILAAFVLRRVWREGLTRETFDLGVTANAIVSPYMLSQSYLLLLALPWSSLACRRPWWAAAVYAASLPMLTRAGGAWDRWGLLDVTFPMVLFLLLLAAAPTGRRSTSRPQ